MKKIKPYLYTSLSILSILIIIFIVKNIFPFGSNSLIWGDMHDQITAFYYHFYDAVYNNGGMFYDYRIAGGVAFIGLFAYYIISPFTLLILLVPRAKIYLMVSVIIACKILMCGLTCQMFIRKYFKKIPGILEVMLALLYAFSGYSLVMYQITPWIDAMYMFPLIMIGLKKVLDLEKPTFYIVCLTLSLICSFYVSMMSVLFIFFASIIYIFNFRKKEDRKKSVSALGISTVLALLLSSFIVIPAYLQINESSRIGFKLSTLLNSRLGPITDKIGLLMFGGLIYVGILLLLINYKKHKSFLKFYLPTLLLVLIPFIVEPINKVWHFGSYAFFPCRFAYITVLMLILGAAYSFNNLEENKKEYKYIKTISIFLTVFVSSIILILTYKFSSQFQTTIHKLSLSYNPKLVLILMFMMLLVIISLYIIIKLNKKLNKLSLILIGIISITHILSTTYLYLGMHKFNSKLTKEYEILLLENKDKDKDDYFRVKSLINPDDTITNSGLVNNYSNIDSFSSLTNRNSLEAYKKLGFGGQWVLTYSRNSTIFMDAILGNKYILTDKNEEIDFYEYINSYQDIYMYKNNNNISFGFLINDNDTIYDKDNSFEIANSLYRNITGNNDDIFSIYSDFVLNNITSKENGSLTSYKQEDKNEKAYFSKEIDVIGKKNLYLELPHTLSNYDNENLNKKFNLYVNDILVCENCFTEPENGTYNIGLFEDEKVNIRLELSGNTLIKNIYLGEMDVLKYFEFIDKYYLDTNVSYKKNSINLSVKADEDKILFIPINYSKNLTATNNGNKVEIIKMYDNFVGIKVNSGNNDITIRYQDNDLVKYLAVSVITLIITFILIRSNLYNKIINNNIVSNISYYLYLSLNVFLYIVVYVLLILIFFLSFIIHI